MHARTETLLALQLQAVRNHHTIRIQKRPILHTYPAAELEEDTERREDDGEDDVDAGRRAVRVRHLAFIRSSLLDRGGEGENIRELGCVVENATS